MPNVWIVLCLVPMTNDKVPCHAYFDGADVSVMLTNNKRFELEVMFCGVTAICLFVHDDKRKGCCRGPWPVSCFQKLRFWRQE